MISKFLIAATALLGQVAGIAWAAPAAASSLSQAEAEEIAVEAYTYLYPLMSMEVTRKVTTNLPAGTRPGFGPVNEFHHMRAFPDASFREVVRPNFDTLYSSAWLDLSKEPVIVSVPDTEGRYYLLPMLDMWTNVFASPGKRTSGTKAGHFAVVPRGWKGKLPKGVEVIDSPSLDVWIIGRTQTNGPKDYAAVHKVQDGYRITPLSKWGKAGSSKPAVASIDSTVDMKTPPLDQVNGMAASKYFSLAAEVMKRNPPQVTDWSQVERFKRIGLEPGKSFDYAKAPAVVRAALDRSVTEGIKRMREKLPTVARVTNGWQMNTDSMGVYGNNYLKRSLVAMLGLGANQPEDAIYPLAFTDASGQPLDGSKAYVLHFSKEELPPAEAFWSLTMYDAQGFQVANRLDRFAIGDRDALKYNSDGSLDLYIQAESPGAELESNWLPSPASGALGLTMRLYAPKAAVFDGQWNPPAIKAVEAASH